MKVVTADEVESIKFQSWDLINVLNFWMHMRSVLVLFAGDR